MQSQGHTLEPPKRGSDRSRLINFLLFVLGVSAFGLALWGWSLFLAPGRPWHEFDILVRSVKVLLLSDIYYDPEPPNEVWQLHAARVLGVGFSLLLALRVVVFAMRTRLARLFLKMRSGHDVVLGWGPAAAAYGAISGKRQTNHVAPDADTTFDRYAFLERSGSIEQQLKAAAAGRARRILVDEGDDALTWQAAQTAARQCRGTDVLAFISDPWLLERLDRATAEVRLNAFSYAGGVARQVMLSHPPYLLARRMQAPAQHILIVGFGAVGQALAREFLITSVSTSPARMMITAIDPAMDRLSQDFIARHPELSAHVDIAFINGDLRRSNEETTAQLRARFAISEPCAAYVAINDASLPLSMGVALRDRAMRLDLFRAPVFVCAEQGAGLSPVRQGAGLVGEPADTPEAWKQVQERAQTEDALCDLRLVTFGTWLDALDGSGLLEPHLDGQARAYHEGYLKLMQSAMAGGEIRPAMRPWSILPDEYRVSNRRAAAHIRAKVDAAGFAGLDMWLGETSPEKPRLSHEVPDEADIFARLDADAISRLGELEHTRWVLDRVLNGWRYGPERNDIRRIHPDIKPNDQLDELTKEKDRNNIRQTAPIIRAVIDGGRKHKRRS